MMRTIYGLLGISLLLFVGGIWFVVLGARGGGRPQAAPVATVKQIMDGMITPASTVVYRAVSTTITAEGVEEEVPANDTEWALVGSHAVAIAEAGRLLLADGRTRNEDAWTRYSEQMIRASMQAYAATQKQDPEALLAAGEVLNNSCDACHREYDADVE